MGSSEDKEQSCLEDTSTSEVIGNRTWRCFLHVALQVGNKLAVEACNDRAHEHTSGVLCMVQAWPSHFCGYTESEVAF